MATRVKTPYRTIKQALGKNVSEFKRCPDRARPTPGVIEALDGFAGAGGFSQALFRVCREAGYRVRSRLFNHWSVALDIARTNLGGIDVFNGAIQDLDPHEVVPGGYLDIFTASPECIFFSQARGAREINDQRRSTAAEILRFAEELDIRTIVLENVDEIRGWAPLDRHRRPIKSQSGVLYRAFLKALRNLGYTVETFTLVASDYGDPTTRKRWYLIAQKGSVRIQKPQQTHSKGGSVPGTLPWVPARSIIDFSAKGNSIFSRKTPHVLKTLRRIRVGLLDQVERAPLAQAYVDAVDRFMEIVELYYAQVDPLPSESKLKRKLTKEEKAHVRSVKAAAAAQHQVLVNEIFATSLGEFTWEQLLLRNALEPTLEGDMHLLMGTMRPIDPIVTKLYGTGTTSDINDPLDTLTAGGRNFAIASAQPDRFLVPPNHGVSTADGSRHASIDEPLDTVTCKNSHGLVEPMLLRANASDTSAWSDAITSVDDPLRTVTTKNNLSVIVPDAVLLPQQDFGNETVRSLGDPLPAVTTISRHGVAQPEACAVPSGFIASYYGPKGERDRAPRTLDDPLATQTGDNTFAFVHPTIVNVKGKSTATSSDEPLPTQTAHAPHLYVLEPSMTQVPAQMSLLEHDVPLAEPFLCSRHEQQAAHVNRTQSLDEPVMTATSRGAGYLVDPVLVSQHYTYNENPSLDEPLVTATTRGAGYIAQPFMVSRHSQERESDNHTHSLEEPVQPVTGDEAGHLVEPIIIPQHRGVDVDSVNEPVRTVTVSNGTGIAFPVPDTFITPNFGERDDQKPRTHRLDDPLPAVTGHGAGMVVASDAGSQPTPGKPFIFIDSSMIELDLLYRMLFREELLKAHSLVTATESFDTSSVSESIAVKLVGNGVAVEVGKACIREALRPRFEADRLALAMRAA